MPVRATASDVVRIFMLFSLIGLDKLNVDTPFFSVDRDIVSTHIAMAHVAIRIKFPVLVTVCAEPATGLCSVLFYFGICNCSKHAKMRR